MRRLATIALTLTLLAAAGVVWATAGAGDDGGAPEYWVELDNAFGLIEGGDLKIAGVRAGTITEMRLDRASNRARVGIRITQNGFGSLRRDVRCEVRPQSLIGEYFVDCLPGTARAELPEGATIPVEQTGSTVPPDLVNNIMRRPYRERLSLILGSLGAGVAGNGEELNAAIRRAAPALRETNRVLATLARQNQVLADLARDADRVVGDLAGNRRDVGRFVVEARDTARASAQRQDELAAGFRELPGFLSELEPTMAALGRASDGQRRSLVNLRASADGLERLFGNLAPFAEASTPAFAALGRAADVGRGAVRAARPVVQELGRFGKGTPELAKNLAIVLEHLDDREWAVEPDPRSPGGKGYTGLEALLTYVYDQTLSTNTYDSTQHYLKVSPFLSPCSNFRDLEAQKEPGLEEQCGGRVGPRALGINSPDPTAEGGGSQPARRAPARTERATPAVPETTNVPAFKQPDPTAAPERPRPQLQIPKILPGQPDLPPIELPRIPLLGLGDDDAGRGTGPGLLPREPRSTPSPETERRLLDFLFGGGR